MGFMFVVEFGCLQEVIRTMHKINTKGFFKMKI